MHSAGRMYGTAVKTGTLVRCRVVSCDYIPTKPIRTLNQGLLYHPTTIILLVVQQMSDCLVLEYFASLFRRVAKLGIQGRIGVHLPGAS